MARTRLTTRVAALKQRKAESQKDGLFPGDVGNMERSKNYHDIDEYHTFEQTVNHELPDMRHDWKDNPREETGHGIPKMAKVYMAAKKATKLAMIMLGEDADEETITAQARDFMRMGGNALTATINRWAEMEENKETAEAPVAEETETPAEDAEAAAPAETTAEETAETPAPAPTADDDKEAPVACEGEPKEGGCNCAEEAEVTAPAEETAEPAEEAPVAEETETPAEDAEADGFAADEEEDVKVDDGLVPAEIEFDEAEEGDVEADPELEDLFTEAEDGDDNEVAPAEDEPVARKAGIKRLAAQPKLVRVAAKKGADELAGIWSKWESPTLC